MNFDPHTVILLYGGQGGEREISLRSAAQTIKGLEKSFHVRPVCLEENLFPSFLSPQMGIVFPLIHGDFGEDGVLQHLLEERGFAFVGSPSEVSRLCIHKAKIKDLARQKNLPVLPHHLLEPGIPLPSPLEERKWVLKPIAKGSSLGIRMAPSVDELSSIWSTIRDDQWMIEPFVEGRELTVGLLKGRALSVVEIVPREGFYDYHNKYLSNTTTYFCPARISSSVEETLRKSSETLFEAAGCLDFARTDFILDSHDQPWLLEINTVPGMTEHSLFPKSAAGEGYTFEAVLQVIVRSAIERFTGFP
jgi:D-alanine-D-alanine ligase